MISPLSPRINTKLKMELQPAATSPRAIPGSAEPQPEALAAEVPGTARRLRSYLFGHTDKHIWGIYLLLCLISIVELYSASSREVSGTGIGVYMPIMRHMAMLAVSFVIVVVMSRMHYSRFVTLVPLFVMLSIGLWLASWFIGEDFNGARRAIRIMGITLQPSEFMKLSAALTIGYLAALFQEKKGMKKNGVWIAAGAVVFFAGTLIFSGLTNTILLLCISLSMLVITGMRLTDLFKIALAYMAGMALLVGVFYIDYKMHAVPGATADMSEMQVSKLTRWETWVSRLEEFGNDSVPKYQQKMTADNRQAMIGFMAQAHGGIKGVMPGNSRETSRLPLAFTDYIYSIIVEELGLVGGLAVLLLYLWLMARAAVLANRVSVNFAAQLVLAASLTIVFQALFHIGIVTGAMPVSGQPLPLISKGGTSILITSIAFGIMLSVSRHATRKGARKKEIEQEESMLPKEMSAANPTQL